MADKKLGFGGQWVQAFGAGKHTGITADGKSKEILVTSDFLQKLSDNYDIALHEAPAVIGHPESDAPAYGWVSATRVKDGKLEIQFSDTEPHFEQMVRDGRFKKRSVKMYLDDRAPGGKAPYLRHVAFLGAQPPAVKGLEDIHFSEDEGETVAFELEFSEGENMTTDKTGDVNQSISDAVAKFFKEKLGIGKDAAPATAAFSEADARTLIDGAVKSAVAPLTEKIASLETENKSLRDAVNAQAGSSKRAEVIAFCEAQERAGKLPPSFRRNGGVEFLEALAGLPADKKITTIEFAEDGKTEKKVETPLFDYAKSLLSGLPPFIQFGEQFDKLKATGDGTEIVDPKRMEDMRDAAGIVPKKDK